MASTGVHGANRLASNSLLEGLVFGARAGASAHRYSCHSHSKVADAKLKVGESRHNPHADSPVPASRADTPQVVNSLRGILWDKVGIIREQAALREAIGQLEELTLPEPVQLDRRCHEARNMLTLARLIASSALARKESRGAHYRTDMPFRDDSTPPLHSFVKKGSAVIFSRDLPADFSGKSAATHK